MRMVIVYWGLRLTGQVLARRQFEQVPVQAWPNQRTDHSDHAQTYKYYNNTHVIFRA